MLNKFFALLSLSACINTQLGLAAPVVSDLVVREEAAAIAIAGAVVTLPEYRREFHVVARQEDISNIADLEKRDSTFATGFNVIGSQFPDVDDDLDLLANAQLETNVKHAFNIAKRNEKRTGFATGYDVSGSRFPDVDDDLDVAVTAQLEANVKHAFNIAKRNEKRSDFATGYSVSGSGFPDVDDELDHETTAQLEINVEAAF